MGELLGKTCGAALKKAEELKAKSVGMCLLSSAIFRGGKPLARVLQIAIETVTEVAPKEMEVTLVGYRPEEADELLEACNVLERNVVNFIMDDSEAREAAKARRLAETEAEIIYIEDSPQYTDPSVEEWMGQK